MNPAQVRKLLEDAAASVTPAESDPAARLARLGRSSARRRRVVGATGTLAAAGVVTAVALSGVFTPGAPSTTSATTTAAAAERRASLGGVSVAVPQGWQTVEVKTLDHCTAQPRTVYLVDGTWESLRPQDTAAAACPSDGEQWMALVRPGHGLAVSPRRLVMSDGQLVHVTTPYEPRTVGSLAVYEAFTLDTQVPSAYISGDEASRSELLARITWPAVPPGPAGGGLALPDPIANAVSDVPPSWAMHSSTERAVLSRIRAALAGLHDPVPAGEECGFVDAVGMALDGGDGKGVVVVLGDEDCPQAVSTGGGRVWAPPTLGRELQGIIAASNNARLAAEAAAAATRTPSPGERPAAATTARG